MKSTLSQFLRFLTKPRLLKLSKNQKDLKADLKWLLLFSFLANILIVGLLSLFQYLKLVKDYEYDPFEKYGTVGFALMAILLAPILEEVIFRWPLRRLYAAIYFICFALAWFMDSAFEKLSPYSALSLVLSSFVVHYIISGLSLRKQVKFWKFLFPYFFYGSTLLFGCIHAYNYEGLKFSDLSFIFYILSPLLTGLILGYIRTKYGLIYSIGFHAIWNGIAITLALLLR